MKKYYNDSKFKMTFDFVPESVIIRGNQFKFELKEITEKEIEINTSGWQTGIYFYQVAKNSEIKLQDKFQILQNMETAPEGFDFRSNAEKTLEAINSYLAGTASSQQKRIKCGDKEIEYSSFEQLIKWKNYYEKLVRKQQGKPANVRFEKLYYRGI